MVSLLKRGEKEEDGKKERTLCFNCTERPAAAVRRQTNTQKPVGLLNVADGRRYLRTIGMLSHELMNYSRSVFFNKTGFSNFWFHVLAQEKLFSYDNTRSSSLAGFSAKRQFL